MLILNEEEYEDYEDRAERFWRWEDRCMTGLDRQGVPMRVGARVRVHRPRARRAAPGTRGPLRSRQRAATDPGGSDEPFDPPPHFEVGPPLVLT